MGGDFDFDGRLKLNKKAVVNILITLTEVALAVFAAYAVTHYGLEKLTVSGEYMSPTLDDGDGVLINKMIYKIFSVKRGDVIVIQKSGSEHSYYTIGRVIGLPGEVIKIKDGYVYVDGVRLDEKLDFPAMENGGLALEDVDLDSDEYFVLCDNRNEGEDSRNANVGNILKSDIVGKAWIRMDPFALISGIDEFGGKD